MEFLTASGSVQLHPAVGERTAHALIDAFVSVPVCDGHVLASHAGRTFELNIDCCLEDRMRFCAALDWLELFIDRHSYIERTQQRWELSIQLGTHQIGSHFNRRDNDGK